MTYPEPVVRVSSDYGTIHDISISLMGHMENEKIENAIMACALTIARLISEHPPTPEQEIKFVDDLMGWAGVYFLGGEAS